MSLNSLFDGAEPPELQVDLGDLYQGPTPLKAWFEAFKYSTYTQTKVKWYLQIILTVQVVMDFMLHQMNYTFVIKLNKNANVATLICHQVFQ